ncbi:prepilin peptidase CpaA [Sulfitobacter undariae]|uniref:Prepilin peptidase CpaA n=1 Tax=Sulfitobacter undariae TaxID=1563671 RepID=A0A7W6GZR5_9RHOB|nr:prepilin peptidase [Sulfitobacter undariae]MBB3992868.1 prepilin peptidase CpaA [Sulfitobacter undariae]
MFLTSYAATWFLPFVLPVCLYVMYTDLSRMKITNNANMALLGIFIVIGLIALPLNIYMWQLVNVVVVLIIGMVLNAVGALGAGDSKFIAAAAPFIAVGDLVMLMWVFAGTFIAALVTHKVAKNTSLHNLAPTWASWHQGKRFPMGFALGATLILYLALGILQGA